MAAHRKPVKRWDVTVRHGLSARPRVTTGHLFAKSAPHATATACASFPGTSIVIVRRHFWWMR